ncbi:MAG TPA: type II secretion system protein GspJ [Spirochaetota bacterium]|nr:type II secretion system protein GspJ [Spirochaetota bacterium]HNT10688.1 type II secretion system protein GspJ [Spirochaetota bacterium]HNV46907.1 type II secretion system protein GspJ [Spirochaetota bacterium]HOS40612.1 type II secretion system protein GspJ [Spirochaetota bacterium]HPU89792.1 type II secretion system protein GspJ [Spirochaetota bacterium]
MRRFVEQVKRLAGDSSGFSLIEILVATVVSSIILMMVYSSHRSIMNAVKDLTGVAEFYENINLAITRIDKDISCAYFNKFNKDVCFLGENNFTPPSSGKINFVTVDRNDINIKLDPKKEFRTSDVHEVGYSLRKDRDSDNLYQLVRREDVHYDDDPETGGRESVLLENVVDIRFEFLLLNNWTPSWDSRKYKKFPRAVKTILKLKNYRGNDEEFVFISYVLMES